MIWAGHVALIGEKRNKYIQGFGGKTGRKEISWKTQARLYDSIKTDFR
jgi:hypothetical protein